MTDAELALHALAEEQQCKICGHWMPKDSFRAHGLGGHDRVFTYEACRTCRELADAMLRGELGYD